MNEPKSKFTWEGLGGLATALAFIFSAIWIIADIKEVQAAHEARIDANAIAIVEVKKDLEHENEEQNNSNLRFQDQVNQQLIRMQDKVDKIYDIVRGTNQ